MRNCAKKMKTSGGRKIAGFALVETVACAFMLAVIVVGVAKGASAINTMKTQTRNTVFLATHNLNCMEQLRQDCYRTKGDLLAYYGPDAFSSSTVNTEVFVQTSLWDNYHIYSIRMVSKVKGYHQELVSKYTMTDIGRYKELEEPLAG